MKRLIIVRHAKSSWKFTEVSDHERSLKEKGIIKANIVSKHLSEKVDSVDAVFSSSANRTLHTAVIFCHNLNIPTEKISINTVLYNMFYRDFIKFVKNIDDKNNTVMMFIHNPLITSIAQDIAGLDIENIPTTGVVDIKLNTNSWNDIEKGGEVLNYITPKLL